MPRQSKREPTPQNIAAFHERLHRWYQAQGRRDLPWRNSRDPYHIYLSETMLQQTQVKTVLERFYFPFLARFPSLAALAAAEESEVLHAWQGLGYYSRARNLHKAAKASGGALPANVAGLRALPGIGQNTAHAVASFAFRLPVPVLEANVKRVVTRIFALRTPTEGPLWEKATLLLDRQNPFDYNQAMMDIGAMVCKKRAPDCPACPASNICAGQDAPEDYPAPKVKKNVPVREKTVVILRNAQGQYYATPRESRFLGGLYHFIELDKGATQLSHGQKTYALAGAKPLGHVSQSYSHFTLEADVLLLAANGSGAGWHGHNALAQLPFSMAEHKILQLLAAQPDAKA